LSKEKQKAALVSGANCFGLGFVPPCVDIAWSLLG